jgi:allantoinase
MSKLVKHFAGILINDASFFIEGQRHMNMESLYDYGARAGFWRLYNLFEKKKIPATIFAVGMALERNPAVAYELHQSKHEVASHGYRWIDYQNVDEETQREHIKRTIDIHEKLLVSTGMTL